MHPVEAVLVPLGWALRNRRPDESKSLALKPEFSAAERIELTSPAFLDGGTIPAQHCGPLIGPEVSPALSWGPLPDATEELLLVFEDVDVPRSEPALHTVVAFATVDGLAEGALTPAGPSFRFLPTLFGRARYVGPRPLPGHGPHRYRFHLYALDSTITLTDVAHLPAAVAGHVLASGTLAGVRKC